VGVPPATWLRDKVDLLVEPAASVSTPEVRRTSRLIAMMLLPPWALCLLTLVVWAIEPDRFVANVEALLVLGLLPFFAAAYILARRGAPRSSAWVLIITTTFAVFVSQFAALVGWNPIYQPTDASALAFLVVPVFLASAVLSRRATALIAAIEIAAMLCVPLVTPVVRFDQLVAGPSLIVLVIAILSIAFSSHQEQLERARSAQLRAEIEERRAAQAELSRHKDELEVLVRERTENLEYAMAQLVEANETKSRFMANMSHELRTPLNSIIGFTGVVKQEMAGPLNDEQKRQLGMVDRSSRHLLGLINQVLDLSRIEAGRETMETDTFEVSALLAEVRDIVAPLAEAKSLRIAMECERLNGRPTVTTDRGKLRQILINLLGNAVKFTERGGVQLSAYRIGDRLVMTVSDTGAGIAPDNLDAVFDEYQQIETHDGGKPQGTGLGLSVSRRLAMLLGGDIEVESELGVGSRFSVAITPAHAADQGL
jgi:signal transduction histidine kinase